MVPMVMSLYTTLSGSYARVRSSQTSMRSVSIESATVGVGKVLQPDICHTGASVVSCVGVLYFRPP